MLKEEKKNKPELYRVGGYEISQGCEGLVEWHWTPNYTNRISRAIITLDIKSRVGLV